ncbi:hypothetical protein EJ06DRAFT_285626 [Trichodelitschia bisporula]|uniref:Uncharacterized protein n=1 Tax=Trichodelitschia bisporula TaxID=703511 RepID=A0A6G1I619_9PEZI|nr:hypothetical protein EJ06DRAFT_285626 [Trichodelitschia bisporula]
MKRVSWSGLESRGCRMSPFIGRCRWPVLVLLQLICGGSRSDEAVAEVIKQWQERSRLPSLAVQPRGHRKNVASA